MEERLLVIVGLEKDQEGATPFVIGALNDEYLNQMALEDGDTEILKMKMTWAADPDAYHWREVVVVVPMERIAGAFKAPVVLGRVEGEE